MSDCAQCDYDRANHGITIHYHPKSTVEKWNRWNMDNPNCDGSGQGNCEPGDVKRYALPHNVGLILCLKHWADENRSAYEQHIKQQDWFKTPAYTDFEV